MIIAALLIVACEQDNKEPGVVRFDDEAFERLCLTMGDTDENGELSLEEAAAIEWLELRDPDPEATELLVVRSVAGLQHFTGLTYLDCSQQPIASVDISNMPRLRWFSCMNTNVSELNVSNNTSLEHLYCSQTDIEILDVSALAGLKFLACARTGLTSLDVSSCLKLIDLSCSNSPITTLTLGELPNLETLRCDGCQLASPPDTSGCEKLQVFIY